MQSKIRIETNGIAIEYEGEQGFIQDGLPELLERVAAMAPKVSRYKGNGAKTSDSGGSIQHMSTNTIASNMNAKSGPDLVMAAITHVQLVRGADRAQRSDILSAMKRATTYYRSTYGSNLSSYLTSLVKAKRINLVAEQTYALTADERESMMEVLQKN